MRGRLACAFLIVFLFLSLAPFDRAIAQKESKNSPTPATADAKEATKTDDDKAAPKPADLKTGPNGQIFLGTGVVNVLVSVTDTYGRFVTGLTQDHFDLFDDKEIGRASCRERV